jgi:thioredoxin reductase (NADPH)
MEKDVVIIGAGPAGLTAGLYAGRELLDVLIIEEGIPGGQTNVTHKIENYPGFPGGIEGIELAKRLKESIDDYKNVSIAMGSVERVIKRDRFFEVVYGGESVIGKAVIVCSGIKQKMLGVKGEKEFFGRGVSICATCDAMFFKNKEVIMVGGGDTAVKEALYLARVASKVKVVHRRDEFRAEKILQDELKKNPKIELWTFRVVEEIVGSSKVEGVYVRNLKTNEKEFIKADGVFIHIGVIPRTDFLKEIDGIEYDENGFIITDENMETKVKGLFAAGDVRSKRFRQVSISVGEGAVAGLSASEYVESIKRGER